MCNIGCDLCNYKSEGKIIIHFSKKFTYFLEKITM